MRRICLILLLATLFAPALARGAVSAPASAGEGSLAVTGGSGTLVVEGHGVIFGYFEQGSLMVVAYHPSDPRTTLSVSGATAQSSGGVTTYTGTDVRFLLPAGRYTLELVASGIDVSAVGRGTAGPAATSSTTSSSGGQPNTGGTIAVNGFNSIPLDSVSGAIPFGGAKLD